MGLIFTTSYLEDSLAVFRQYKAMAERAMAQVTDDQLFQTLDSESNSIAVLVKHLAGNMRSRWIGFPETDGEKPNRHRDAEFESPPTSRSELLAVWEHGWQCLFNALEPLKEDDLVCTTMIRNEPHSVMQAINRQIAHYASHSGQIVLLAKHFGADHWQTLSVARGRSEEFNRSVRSGEKSQR
jgi:hypothetical protein